MELTDRDLDRRTLRRDLERGRINEADVIRAMEALPDVSDNIAPPASATPAAPAEPDDAADGE